MEYGLTDKGFVVKPFQVILEEEREAWKKAFGYDIDTSGESPEGAYIGNQTIKLTQLWEMFGGLWAAGDADSASGVYLDRLASFVNVLRLPAEATRVYAALWGDEGTPVLAGHQAKLDTGELFALQSSVVLGRESLLGFVFKIAEIAEGAYSFQINGQTIYCIAAEGDTQEDVQGALFDQIEAVYPGEYTAVNNGTDGMEIHSVVGIVPFALFCNDPKIEIATLGALGIYRAEEPGPTFAAIRTLNTIVSNVNGLDHIINYATGITGRTVESDAELRIEKNNRQKQASGNEIAIENEIKKLSGVLFAKVYSNRQAIEVNGRPPKCFEAIVVGGVDQEIAETIFLKGPAGIEAFGSTLITVKDAEGFPWEIGFSRPENRFIWLRIEYSKNAEETFPLAGEEMIKDNIDAWGAEHQDVGTDFVFQKLLRPVYDVVGIAFANIAAAETNDLTPPNDEDYVAANIAITERQIALIDKTRITVTQLAEEV
jgi:uncharacterized phage protein gp47/JayE